MNFKIIIFLIFLTSCSSFQIPFYDGEVRIPISKKFDTSWAESKSIGLRSLTINGTEVELSKDNYFRKLVTKYLKLYFQNLKIVQTESFSETFSKKILKTQPFKRPDYYIDINIVKEYHGEISYLNIPNILAITYVNIVDAKTGLNVRSSGSGHTSSQEEALLCSLRTSIERLKVKNFSMLIPALSSSKDEDLKKAYSEIEQGEFKNSEKTIQQLLKTKKPDEDVLKGAYYLLSYLAYLDSNPESSEENLLLSLKHGLKLQEAWEASGKMKNITDLRGSSYRIEND